MIEYKVEIISPQQKEELLLEIVSKVRFERKANVHGACVKLLTDNQSFKEEWEDNFKFMNEDIRPHTKIFSLDDGGELQVKYDTISKTCIILNCDYYGWVKSIALATISDFFEDSQSEHRRYSVHGSAVDCGGHSMAIIGPPGTGKTTLTYGLLQDENFNYISDDWFFTRLLTNAVVVYSSEKNSYIREDIVKIWKNFSDDLAQVQLDHKGRGIADVNSLFGGRTRESSTIKNVILLERDKDHPPIRKLDAEEALVFMMENDFCNPHQLVRDKRKLNIRKAFFQDLFTDVDVYLLNTVETPEESLERIKHLLN